MQTVLCENWLSVRLRRKNFLFQVGTRSRLLIAYYAKVALRAQWRLKFAAVFVWYVTSRRRWLWAILTTSIIAVNVVKESKLNFRFSEKATKIWKKNPLVLTLLSKINLNKEISNDSPEICQWDLGGNEKDIVKDKATPLPNLLSSKLGIDWVLNFVPWMIWTYNSFEVPNSKLVIKWSQGNEFRIWLKFLKLYLFFFAHWRSSFLFSTYSEILFFLLFAFKDPVRIATTVTNN